jgi:hypothetical protein
MHGQEYEMQTLFFLNRSISYFLGSRLPVGFLNQLKTYENMRCKHFFSSTRVGKLENKLKTTLNQSGVAVHLTKKTLRKN